MNTFDDMMTTQISETNNPKVKSAKVKLHVCRPHRMTHAGGLIINLENHILFQIKLSQAQTFGVAILGLG